MLGINPKIAYLKLNIDPSAKAVHQMKQPWSAQMENRVANEIDYLL